MMMTLMMMDTPFSLPTDCQKTASSVKALFHYTPSPPMKEASVRDPVIKQNVNYFFLGLTHVCVLFVYVHDIVNGNVKICISVGLIGTKT